MIRFVEVGTKKPPNVGVELKLKDILKEEGVVDRVKGTGEIDSYTNCSVNWFLTVQTSGDLIMGFL